jgi:hypothetical protein
MSKTPKERRSFLYNKLKELSLFSKSEDEFNNYYADESRLRDRLYKSLNERGLVSVDYEQFRDSYFGDIIKSSGPSFQKEMQRQFGNLETTPFNSPQSDSKVDEKAEMVKNIAMIRQKMDMNIQNAMDKAKSKVEERQRKLSDFYDKVSINFDNDSDAFKNAYKSWSAESGALDRYNYLEQKAQSEAVEKRQDLVNAVGSMKALSEQRRKAVLAGDLDEYSRINKLMQGGAEYLRLNKQGADAKLTDLRTETGLKIWEESIAFASDMLNAKMERLTQNPDTQQKLTRLASLREELKKKETPELLKEYQDLLSQPEMAEINKVSKHGNILIEKEKDLAKKYPDLFHKRLKRQAKQEAVDRLFTGLDAMGTKSGVIYGVLNQLGRSATGLLADMAKLPAIADHDNTYGWEDKWSDTINSFVDFVEDEAFPVPSDYAKPMFYTDEQGNQVFRQDLIIPKTAKIGGDMAALLFGAGKISKLGKVAGLSTEVSTGVGLFTSSFVQSHDEYKKAGEEAGMSPAEAAWFATSASTVTSALELISPNRFLWSKGDLATNVLKNLTTGASRKEALKESLKFIGKEIGAENLQELTQQLGDIAVQAGANRLTGNNYFEHNQEQILNEAMETMVLTSLVSGIPSSGASAMNLSNRSTNYKDAIRLVAENSEKYFPLLQETFKTSKADPEVVKRIVADINSVARPKNGQPLYVVDEIPVEKSVIQEKIEKGDLQGVYIANDETLFAEVQQKVNDIANSTFPYLTGITKSESKKKVDKLIESGDVVMDGHQIKAKTTKGVDDLNKIIRNNSGYIKAFLPKKSAERIKDVPLLEDGKGYHDFKDLDLKEFSESEKDPQRKRIAEVLLKAKSTLSAIKPGVRVAMYSGPEQGNALLKKIGSRSVLQESVNGFYDPKSGVIGIDLTKADESTAFHETIHPIVDLIKSAKPQLFNDLSYQAAETELPLEDGTVVKYVNYTNGNREEALVELLSDFASGKYDELDKNHSIIERVKDILNKILEAVGLTSADFNINLEKISDAKDLADSIAKALHKGKTIKIKGGANASPVESETKFQNQGPKKKKLNQTARKVAYQDLIKDKKLQTDILSNPLDYSYDPQKYKDIDKYLEALTDAELDNMIDLNNQMAVLAAIKLIKRYQAQGKDTIPVFKKLREIGTSVGQLLRQFGELKNKTSIGIVDTVMGNLESLKVTLTPEQKQVLQGLADKYIEVNNKLDEKREEYSQAPSSLLDKEISDLQKEQDLALEKLLTFVGQVTPLGIDSVLATILQGNLLTVQSTIVNPTANILLQPFRMMEQFGGDVATYLVFHNKRLTLPKKISSLKNQIKIETNPAKQKKLATRLEKMQNAHDSLPKSMLDPISIFFKSWLQGLRGSVIGVKAGAVGLVKGPPLEAVTGLEVRRNIQPIQALWQLFSQLFPKAGRKTLPVNENGKVPLHVYIEKVIETIGGPNASIMFRALYAGDAPFRTAGKYAGGFRLFAEKGGKTNTEFDAFLKSLSPEEKDAIEKLGNEATLSDERTVAKFGEWLIKTIYKGADLGAQKVAPHPAIEEALRTVAKVFIKANAPFVRVPANALQHLIEWAVPIIPLAASSHYAFKGDTRKSAQLFVRATTGCALWYFANMLYDAGVVLASGEGDEEDERNLKYAMGGPNTINIDALARFCNGTQDPTRPYQKGDRTVNYSKLGQLGMYLMWNAEFNESLTKKLKIPRHEASVPSMISRAFNSVAKTSLEMSYLQGSYVALEAINKGKVEDYIANIGNTFEALIIPNNVSTFTKARSPFMLRAEDDNVIQQFYEKHSVKVNPTLDKSVLGVYPILNMWGEPVAQNPDKNAFGRVNPWIYQFFDITKGRIIEDEMSLEMFNLAKRVGDVAITVPSPSIEIGDKKFQLTEQDFTYLQMLTGKYKRMVVGFEMQQPEWKTYTDDEKQILLKNINEAANRSMRKYILGLIYEGIENGSIVLDERMGRYTYLSPGEFDFDFAKKVLEEMDN